jgi:hypothetical protein
MSQTRKSVTETEFDDSASAVERLVNSTPNRNT